MKRRFEPEQWIAIAVLICVCLGLSLVGCAGVPSAAGPRPTLLVFISPTCYGCLQDYGTIEKIVDMGLVTVEVITVETSPDDARDWNVTSVPTYILTLDGQEIHRCHQAELARRRIQSLYRQ